MPKLFSDLVYWYLIGRLFCMAYFCMHIINSQLPSLTSCDWWIYHAISCYTTASFSDSFLYLIGPVTIVYFSMTHNKLKEITVPLEALTRLTLVTNRGNEIQFFPRYKKGHRYSYHWCNHKYGGFFYETYLFGSRVRAFTLFWCFFGMKCQNNHN